MRKLLRWGWLPVLVAFVYSGWVLYSRSSQNRQIDAEHERSKAEKDAALVEKLGGSELKIVAFYANPTMIRQGSRGLLCYGVVNAKSVEVDPKIPDVGPALSRCIEAAPTRTTTYTLTAKDDNGNQVSSTATLTVE